ncbi:MAG: Glu/Leu/Phe/Val dehydrogenase dimerization domain-containing protein [Candidatus Ozemobacteraceae bacterium]
MSIFEELTRINGEEIFFLQHRDTGLQAVLATHDSSLGPVVGGIRFQTFEDEKTAARETLRLAEKTTLTAALFGCDVGGGKIIVGCRSEQATETMFRALGSYIQGLNGRFFAFADPGFSSVLLAAVAKETEYVLEMTHPTGGTGLDDAGLAARGILLTLKEAVVQRFETSFLEGRTIAVHGVTGLGKPLIQLFLEEGARVTISDPSFERVTQAKRMFPDVAIAMPGDIPFLPVDIFVPCVPGESLSRDAVRKLNCKILAGVVENPLAQEEMVEFLHEAGTLYIPDFLLQAGSLITVHAALKGHSDEETARTIESIAPRIGSILKQARAAGISPMAQARLLAQERIAAVRTLKKIYRV